MTQLHQAVPLVERQHALIEELCARAPRYVPARVLAERTGTSIRTIARDIDRLIAAGLPVEVRRGPGGGFRLAASATAATVTFRASEVAALVASLVAVGPYTSAAAVNALTKLTALYR